MHTDEQALLSMSCACSRKH